MRGHDFWNDLPWDDLLSYSQVYNPWPANLDALEANLRREVALLDPGMIRRAIFDMRVRARVVKADFLKAVREAVA